MLSNLPNTINSAGNRFCKLLSLHSLSIVGIVAALSDPDAGAVCSVAFNCLLIGK